MRSGTLRLPAGLLRRLEEALRGLRYGSVQLIVHDAHVVRIERLERFRLTDSSEAVSLTSGPPTAPAEDDPHVPLED